MNTTNTMYKIGDYVRVRNDLAIGNNYRVTNLTEDIAVTENMTAFSGLIVRIRIIAHIRDFDGDRNAYLIEHPTIEDGNSIWVDEMFENAVSEEAGKTSFIDALLTLIKETGEYILEKLHTKSNEDLTAKFHTIAYAANELSMLTGLPVRFCPQDETTTDETN